MPKPLSDHAISRLSSAQRSMLIDHIDGSVELAISYLTQVRRSLMQTGLLRGHPVNSNRPRHTVLTEEGRRVVGMVLGEYADALVRAGLLEQDNPLQVLRTLKAARKPEVTPILPAVVALALKPG